MPTRELPAVDWLGYGIDLSRTPTMDVHAVAVSVLKDRRIIDFDLDNTRQVTIGGVAYDVPRAISASSLQLSQSSFTTYATGGDAQNAFRVDSGLPSLYLAITGTDSAMVLAHDRLFIRGNQYAFFNFTHGGYVASLRDYDDLLNQTALLQGVEDLPPEFDENKDDVVAAYKSFFERFGTHTIVNANYGSRFQLNAWASNGNASVNAKFATNVKAFFNGIPDGGEYDTTVKSEAQYKVFVEYLQSLVTANGGDAQLSSDLTSDPTDWQKYSQWINSVDTAAPTYISFQTSAIWTLMSASVNATLRAYAKQLSAAFSWILSHPRVYKTTVTFDIRSDWGEFNLLTSNATILADSANPYPQDTVASSTRVQWGKERSHTYQMQTLKFSVVNDGTPVDFSISHGSNGPARGQGSAEALIESKSYVNNTITDDTWNTVWFFGVSVTLTPEALQLRNRRGGVYTWDDILDAYLRSIGAATQACEVEE